MAKISSDVENMLLSPYCLFVESQSADLVALPKPISSQSESVINVMNEVDYEFSGFSSKEAPCMN